MTDDCEVASVPQRRRRRLVDTDSGASEALQFRLCAAGDWSSSVPRHRSIQ